MTDAIQIALRGVTHAYKTDSGPLPVLRDLNIEIPEGEFCAKNGGHLMHGGCFGKTHSTVQSVMIGNGYSAQTQTASGFHQFFQSSPNIGLRLLD